MAAPASTAPLAPGEPLDPRERARGRRLAIASHPAGMTHRMSTTEHLPTLALLALGASEAVVGAQRTLVYLAVGLQLPVLRLVGRLSKRTLLVAGQGLALAGTVPLVFFASLQALDPAWGTAVALAAFTLAAAGFAVGETVWFPLLHGYQEPGRIGRFFGWLRSGWHLTLIVYFLGAQRWLAARPGDFAPLFAVGFALGVVRIAMIARLPERSERTGRPIPLGETLARLRSDRLLRRYLLGIGIGGSVRTVAFPFALVMFRRVVGFSEAQVLYATAALFAGGLATLLLWGRIVDRTGPEPVFRWTAIGMAALVLALGAVTQLDTAHLLLAVCLFFALHALGCGFDVADTHVLFRLAPDDAPARLIVVARVVDVTLRGIAPLVAGVALDRVLAAGADPVAAYRTLFALCAAAQLAAILPLRVFRGPFGEAGGGG